MALAVCYCSAAVSHAPFHFPSGSWGHFNLPRPTGNRRERALASHKLLTSCVPWSCDVTSLTFGLIINNTFKAFWQGCVHRVSWVVHQRGTTDHSVAAGDRQVQKVVESTDSGKTLGLGPQLHHLLGIWSSTSC